MKEETIFDLTSEQQKAFNRLKKAYKDLGKLGVGFYNCYGTLYPYQSKYIKDVTDREGDIPLIGDTTKFTNGLDIANEWSDDGHFVHLTELGRKKYNNAQ